MNNPDEVAFARSPAEALYDARQALGTKDVRIGPPSLPFGLTCMEWNGCGCSIRSVGQGFEMTPCQEHAREVFEMFERCAGMLP